ncbi:MAG TPA: hypothetical protein V6D17_17780 [Candidatus Obscuribacterales bacterium]
MQRTFERFKHGNFSGLIVFVPMIDGDTHESADRQATELIDRRVKHRWDGEKSISEAFAPVLGLTKPAWDVYLVYDSQAEWTDKTPPKPSFWMHQLSSDRGAPRAWFLDQESFNEQVKMYLDEG